MDSLRESGCMHHLVERLHIVAMDRGEPTVKQRLCYESKVNRLLHEFLVDAQPKAVPLNSLRSLFSLIIICFLISSVQVSFEILQAIYLTRYDYRYKGMHSPGTKYIIVRYI